jgi:hypothetical protein
MAIIRSTYAQVAGDTVSTYLQALQNPHKLSKPKKIDNFGKFTNKDNLGNTITTVRMNHGLATIDCFGQRLDNIFGWPFLVPKGRINSPYWHTVIADEASFQ